MLKIETLEEIRNLKKGDVLVYKKALEKKIYIVKEIDPKLVNVVNPEANSTETLSTDMLISDNWWVE